MKGYRLSNAGEKRWNEYCKAVKITLKAICKMHETDELKSLKNEDFEIAIIDIVGGAMTKQVTEMFNDLVAVYEKQQKEKIERQA